jgi:hypothetical protein
MGVLLPFQMRREGNKFVRDVALTVLSGTVHMINTNCLDGKETIERWCYGHWQWHSALDFEGSSFGHLHQIHNVWHLCASLN